MPRGTTKRRPVTITALLDAALDLFAEQGYGATSIPEICARAGLTKGAFYSNFANKDALFLALLDRSWERRAAWIRRAMAAGGALAGAPTTRPASPTPWWTGNGHSSPWSSPCTPSADPTSRGSSSSTSGASASELAILVTEALETAGRLPTLPVDELARMIVAVSEGSDIQVLTDGAGGAALRSDLGPRAVTGLLQHFSVPTERS